MSTFIKTLINLQLNGIHGAGLEPGRKGGAGPAYSKAFLINDKCVMLPVNNESAAFSAECQGEQFILRDKEDEISARPVAKAKFYELATKDGIPYSKIALLHGRDCLASTVIQNCSRYADTDKRCRFCSLATTLKNRGTLPRKTPEQLAEVAKAARDLDHVTHVTLTSGTMRHRDKGILYLGRCAQAITEATGLPVQLQFEPPENFEVFDILKSNGVANIGMHVESLDENTRARITPGKSEIPLSEYFRAFEQAVKVFGPNHVSTYIILGLGEDEDLTLNGTLRLIEMGVYPVIVPLHKHPDAALATASGPSQEFAYKIYREAGRALAEKGMNSKSCRAGCGRCGACSLLQYTELPELELKVAETAADIEACHEIRRQVFCDEQHIFSCDDSDARDAEAVHILARCNGVPAGAVRCFKRHDGIWVGGRLAVLKNFRGNLGAKLVRKAVRTMEEKPDVRRFFAIIQDQNIRFFKLLGWKPLGKLFICNGRPHQVMEKPLKGRPDNFQSKTAGI